MKKILYFAMSNAAAESFDAGTPEKEMNKPAEGTATPEQKLAAKVYDKLHGAESQELLSPANLDQEKAALAMALAEMDTLEALNA